MLDVGRIDAAFGFPVEVQYLSKKMGLRNDLVVLPIQNMVPYSPVYFAAPKNTWGRKIIARINRILNRDGVIGKFNAYYEYWLDDGNKRYYQTLKEAHYQNTSK